MSGEKNKVSSDDVAEISAEDIMGEKSEDVAVIVTHDLPASHEIIEGPATIINPSAGKYDGDCGDKH